MAAGEIPERVTHNDTKLNNVMLDEKTGEGICVIDLDTVMPGLSLYDFGDLVRFAANTASEDEPDLTKVDVSLPIFEAIVEGYIAGAGDILTDAEWNNLVFACKLMTYEVGIRFLTDYLQGDIYFKIHHPGHNLERARNQLRLVDRIETADGALQAIVRRYRAAR
jgi:aminoglycoside phosphotransferase (APT) family kinase protein